MQKEKLAAIVLVIIIVGALSTFLLITYGGDIFKNLFPEEKTEKLEENIEVGDCVDINYIGRYTSNNTIFSTSYEDPDSKTGGSPLKVFVNLNISDLTIQPPENYTDYVSSPIMSQSIEQYLDLALSPIGVKKGFMDELISMKKGDNRKKTTHNFTPEQAFGRSPVVGDVLNLTSLGSIEYEIVGIKKNVQMPQEIAELYEDYFGNGTTTIFTLRDNSHYIGEIIDKYACWINSTVVTKSNQTLLWIYTTPTTAVDEDFTWIEDNETTGIRLEFPINASRITDITDSTITITHSPEINTTIEESYMSPYGYYMPVATYTVKKVTADKINVSYEIDSEGNISYKDFDRTIIIQRNSTINITEDTIGEILEIQLMFLRQFIDDFIIGYNVCSDQTVYFEIVIENIYKTSQE